MGESGTKATDESGTDAAAANQIFWLSANTYPGSRRHPEPLSIKSFLVKAALVAHHVEGSSRQLVSQGLDGDHILGFGAFALMKGFRTRRIAHREVGRLDIGPRQIAVAVFAVALSFFLGIGKLLAFDTTAVGSKVAGLGKTPNIAALQHDRQR